MFRLNTVVRYALLIPALAFPQLSDAQGCESPKIASADEAVSAVDHGDIKTEFCARAAFQLIERLPKDEAIPILIQHLADRILGSESRREQYRGRQRDYGSWPDSARRCGAHDQAAAPKECGVGRYSSGPAFGRRRSGNAEKVVLVKTASPAM